VQNLISFLLKSRTIEISRFIPPSRRRA